MEKTYKYFQPKYVSEFKCDGSKCKAFCCKRWKITIDNKTYNKYKNIRPKNAAREIIKHIKRDEQGNRYVVLDKNRSCPMLTEDNLCIIQKTYGEEYLSETCVAYPRRTYKFNDFYERSLVLTCPVASTNILLQQQPLEFEYVEVPQIIHDNLGRIKSQYTKVPIELWEHFVNIQLASIAILQERSLTIDQRLIALGFFIDRLSELIEMRQLDGIKKLTDIYKSKDFLLEQAPIFSSSINFNVNEYINIIFGTFDALYGDKGTFKERDAYFIDSIDDVFQVSIKETDQIPISKLAETYLDFGEFRKIFVEHNATVFENYLVNEFFMNAYPWKFRESIEYNYSVFLTIYKMLELISITVAIKNFNKDDKNILDKVELVSDIVLIVNNIDHNNKYIGKISEYLKDKNDIIKIMESLLQG